MALSESKSYCGKVWQMFQCSLFDKIIQLPYYEGFLLKYFPNNFAQKQPPEVFYKKRCS